MLLLNTRVIISNNGTKKYIRLNTEGDKNRFRTREVDAVLVSIKLDKPVSTCSQGTNEVRKDKPIENYSHRTAKMGKTIKIK